MGDYRKKSDAVQAVRWNRIGDPVGDRPLFRGDPRMVVPYKRDGIAETTLCVHCNTPMKDHGWMDAPPSPLNPASATLRVNPVSGEHSTAAPPPTPLGYPKHFERPSASFPGQTEQRNVTSPAEEHEAMREGFHFVSGSNIAGPGPTPDAYPKTFVKKAKHSDDPHNQAPDETRVVKTLADEQKAEREGFEIFVEPEHAESDKYEDDRRTQAIDENVYPKTFVKGADNPDSAPERRTVHDLGEEHTAADQGFHQVDERRATRDFDPLGPPHPVPENATLAEQLADPRQQGEPRVSRDDVEPGYPKTLVKFSGPNLIVHNADEEKKATEDGYRTGVVICPGQFVVLPPSGQLEVVGKHLFEANYVRV